MAVNTELTKIVNIVQLMDLTLNNRPIVDSDGELIKNSLRAIDHLFSTLPENSIHSNCTQAIIRDIKANLDAVTYRFFEIVTEQSVVDG